MSITNISDLYKELIGESTKEEFLVKPYVVFMKFDPEEVLQYKDQDKLNIIRPLNELKQYEVGMYIKPEWGKVYKIEDKQLYNDITDWKYFNTLSTEQVKVLSQANTEMYIALTLERVVKKNIKRIFYDFEFDESPSYGIRPISVGFVDEDGKELYLINKDYDWNSCTNTWLIKNIKPKLINTPDYLKVSLKIMKERILDFINPGPSKLIKLYGYYSAYDHVALCQLFGKMVDLPKGLPMYTNDLKQYMDYFGVKKSDLNIEDPIEEHDALADAKWNKELYNILKEKFGNKYI